MYEEALRTPLLMMLPVEIQKGIESNHLVQNLDIAPTLLEAAGIKIPEDMQGKPLQQTWNDSTESWRDAIYYHYYEKGFGATPHYGVRTDRYKLIHFYDVVDSWELYDLKEDPREMNNLYTNAAYQDIVADLKMKLQDLRTTFKDTATNYE